VAGGIGRVHERPEGANRIAVNGRAGPRVRTWPAAKGASVQALSSSASLDGAGGRGPTARFARRSAVPLLFDLTTLADASGQVMSSLDLIDHVGRGAEPGCDIRVLVEDVDAHHGELQELADHRRCDVYVVGAGVVLEDVAGEIVAFDRATDQPADWLVIRPGDIGESLPTWFERAKGRVRVRPGVVTLPIQAGLALANRRTFLEMAQFAATTRRSTDGLTPLVASVHNGQFCMAWYSGAESVLGGADLARFLSASLETLEPHVQLALAWPDDEDERHIVDAELLEMTEVLDRAVWVPEPGCRAARLNGLDELAAVDSNDRPARWVAYAPSTDPDSREAFDTDARGVLVWRGEGTNEPVRAEERDGPEHTQLVRRADSAFRTLDFDVPADAIRLTRLACAWADYLAEYEKAGRAELIGGPGQQALAEFRQELEGLLDAETVQPPLAGTNRPALRPAPHSHPPHRLPWLPRSPLANAAATHLYCWSPTSPERLASEGLALSDLYLVAHPEPTQLARPGRSGFVLRLDAPPGTAIVSEYLPDFRPVEPDSYLIPVMWLSRVRLSAWYGVDTAGTIGPEHRPTQPQLRVSFRGAGHGVDGLPEGAVRWPRRRKYATAHLTLPDDPQWITTRLQTYPGWLPLQRHRVNPASGYRILDVEVPREAAVDVPETLAELGNAPLAQSPLAPFVGVDLVLPAGRFAYTAITNVRDSGPNDRRTAHRSLIGRTVSEALPVQWRLPHQEVGVVTDVSGPTTRHS
jgi:hypothetical protein